MMPVQDPNSGSGGQATTKAPMSDYDLIIRGGTVVTAADTVRADVGIRGGTIVALAEALAAGAQKRSTRTGLYVMPGGIDSHVHLAQPSGAGIVMADGFESGTRSAIAGGNTTVIPFAVQPRGASLREVVKEYHRKADGQALCDYGFHLVVTDPTPDAARPGTAGARRRRLHLLQGLHDLRRHGARRPSIARRVRLRPRLRRPRDGALRGLRRHQVHDRAARAGRQGLAPYYHACRGPKSSSARPPTAPSAMPNSSTCR